MKTLTNFIKESLAKAESPLNVTRKYSNPFDDKNHDVRRVKKGDILYGLQFNVKSPNSTTKTPVEYKVKEVKSEVEKLDGDKTVVVTKTIYVDENEMNVTAFTQSYKIEIDDKDYWDKLKNFQDYINTDDVLVGAKWHKRNDYEYDIVNMILKGSNKLVAALPKSKRKWGGYGLYVNKDDLKAWLTEYAGARSYFNVSGADENDWESWEDISTPEAADKFIEKYKDRFTKKTTTTCEDILGMLGALEYDKYNGGPNGERWYQLGEGETFVDTYFPSKPKQCYDLFNNSDKVTLYYGDFDGVLNMKDDYFTQNLYFEYKDKKYLILGFSKSDIKDFDYKWEKA